MLSREDLIQLAAQEALTVQDRGQSDEDLSREIAQGMCQSRQAVVPDCFGKERQWDRFIPDSEKEEGITYLCRECAVEKPCEIVFESDHPELGRPIDEMVPPEPKKKETGVRYATRLSEKLNFHAGRRQDKILALIVGEKKAKKPTDLLKRLDKLFPDAQDKNAQAITATLKKLGQVGYLKKKDGKFYVCREDLER